MKDGLAAILFFDFLYAFFFILHFNQSAVGLQLRAQFNLRPTFSRLHDSEKSILSCLLQIKYPRGSRQSIAVRSCRRVQVPRRRRNLKSDHWLSGSDRDTYHFQLIPSSPRRSILSLEKADLQAELSFQSNGPEKVCSR